MVGRGVCRVLDRSPGPYRLTTQKSSKAGLVDVDQPIDGSPESDLHSLWTRVSEGEVAVIASHLCRRSRELTEAASHPVGRGWHPLVGGEIRHFGDDMTLGWEARRIKQRRAPYPRAARDGRAPESFSSYPNRADYSEPRYNWFSVHRRLGAQIRPSIR
jgi:hypothetical protein